MERGQISPIRTVNSAEGENKPTRLIRRGREERGTEIGHICTSIEKKERTTKKRKTQQKKPQGEKKRVWRHVGVGWWGSGCRGWSGGRRSGSSVRLAPNMALHHWGLLLPVGGQYGGLGGGEGVGVVWWLDTCTDTRWGARAGPVVSACGPGGWLTEVVVVCWERDR